MSTFNVRLWDIRKNEGKRRPYEVRWIVGGREKSRSFVTKLLAEGFRGDLMKALRQGEPFDPATGLPESKAKDEPWFDHVTGYMQMKWPRAAAKTRRTTADALVTVTLALLSRRRGRPDDEVLRHALYGWAFNPSKDRATAPVDVTDALAWLRAASLPVSTLRQLDTVRAVLDALAMRIDGKPAAATTIYRKRAVFYNALGYAVERGLLVSNPIDSIQWKAPDVADAVDRRVVANPEQAARLIAAVADQGRRGPHLVAFFGCLYYAGMRPSEAVALRESNCRLPSTGWGRLELTGSEPRAGADWTDDGAARESRQLKRRSMATVRAVPIPPELVAHLRKHLDTYRSGSDGRLFRTEADGPLQDTAIRKAWRAARVDVLTEVEVASPLAARPYDLRHAAASLWLNSGVPATEVARRLGHSVAVLLKVYANCIDGQENEVNARIQAALIGAGERGTLGAPEGSELGPDGKSAGQVRDGSGDREAPKAKTAGRRAGRAADGGSLENC